MYELDGCGKYERRFLRGSCGLKFLCPAMIRRLPCRFLRGSCGLKSIVTGSLMRHHLSLSARKLWIEICPILHRYFFLPSLSARKLWIEIKSMPGYAKISPGRFLRGSCGLKFGRRGYLIYIIRVFYQTRGFARLPIRIVYLLDAMKKKYYY